MAPSQNVMMARIHSKYIAEVHAAVMAELPFGKQPKTKGVKL